MSTAAITTNVTNPDEEDRRAMDLKIAQENERRAALNPPLVALPNSTAAERKSSYETVMAQALAGFHASAITEAGTVKLFRDLKPLWDTATDAKRAAAITALQ